MGVCVDEARKRRVSVSFCETPLIKGGCASPLCLAGCLSPRPDLVACAVCACSSVARLVATDTIIYRSFSEAWHQPIVVPPFDHLQVQVKEARVRNARTQLRHWLRLRQPRRRRLRLPQEEQLDSSRPTLNNLWHRRHRCPYASASFPKVVCCLGGLCWSSLSIRCSSLA